MKRAAFAALLFLIPFAIGAAAPSELLSQVLGDRRPKSFFVTVDAGGKNEGFIAKLKFWGTTEAEGEPGAKHTMYLLAHVANHAEGHDVHAFIETRARDGLLYVKIHEAWGQLWGRPLEPFARAWFSMPLAQSRMLGWPGAVIVLDQWNLRPLDAVLTEEEKKFSAGYTHQWTLATGMEGALQETLVAMGLDGLLEPLPGRNQLDVKVDTNLDGMFLFMRGAAMLRVRGVSTKVEGTVQHRTSPVRIEKPLKSEPIDGVLPRLRELATTLLPDITMSPVPAAPREETPSPAPVERPRRTMKTPSAAILERLQKHIMLTDTENVRVLRIVDIKSLREEDPFFTAATKGDYVIVTPSRSILYDAHRDRVLSVAETRQPSCPWPPTPASLQRRRKGLCRDGSRQRNPRQIQREAFFDE